MNNNRYFNLEKNKNINKKNKNININKKNKYKEVNIVLKKYNVSPILRFSCIFSKFKDKIIRID